jgi:ATP synthase protein I
MRMSENQGSSKPSFEERLRAARAKQGLDPKPPAPNAGLPTSSMGIGLRVGMELVCALAVSVGIGWSLDWWLGTRPWFLVVFIPLGGAAGLMNVWRLVGPRK